MTIEKVDTPEQADVPGYETLHEVLMQAYSQAARGKGAIRHNISRTTPYERQRMQLISELIDSPKGMEYQACKKITEGMNLPTHTAQVNELLGAINYLAGIIIFLRKQQAMSDSFGHSDMPVAVEQGIALHEVVEAVVEAIEPTLVDPVSEL